LALDRSGNIVAELGKFEEDFQCVELLGGDIVAQKPAAEADMETDITLIHHALVLGIKDYFVKSGFKKALLGLSGGIDSAVVAALAIEALGAENVLAVLMPSV